MEATRSMKLLFIFLCLSAFIARVVESQGKDPKKGGKSAKAPMGTSLSTHKYTITSNTSSNTSTSREERVSSLLSQSRHSHQSSSQNGSGYTQQLTSQNEESGESAGDSESAVGDSSHTKARRGGQSQFFSSAEVKSNHQTHTRRVDASDEDGRSGGENDEILFGVVDVEQAAKKLKGTFPDGYATSRNRGTDVIQAFPFEEEILKILGLNVVDVSTYETIFSSVTTSTEYTTMYTEFQSAATTLKSKNSDHDNTVKELTEVVAENKRILPKLKTYRQSFPSVNKDKGHPWKMNLIIETDPSGHETKTSKWKMITGNVKRILKTESLGSITTIVESANSFLDSLAGAIAFESVDEHVKTHLFPILESADKENGLFELSCEMENILLSLNLKTENLYDEYIKNVVNSDSSDGLVKFLSDRKEVKQIATHSKELQKRQDRYGKALEVFISQLDAYKAMKIESGTIPSAMLNNMVDEVDKVFRHYQHYHENAGSNEDEDVQREIKGLERGRKELARNLREFDETVILKANERHDIAWNFTQLMKDKNGQVAGAYASLSNDTDLKKNLDNLKEPADVVKSSSDTIRFILRDLTKRYNEPKKKEEELKEKEDTLKSEIREVSERLEELETKLREQESVARHSCRLDRSTRLWDELSREAESFTSLFLLKGGNVYGRTRKYKTYVADFEKEGDRTKKVKINEDIVNCIHEVENYFAKLCVMGETAGMADQLVDFLDRFCHKTFRAKYYRFNETKTPHDGEIDFSDCDSDYDRNASDDEIDSDGSLKKMISRQQRRKSKNAKKRKGRRSGQGGRRRSDRRMRRRQQRRGKH